MPWQLAGKGEMGWTVMVASEVTCHDVRGSPLPPASLDFKTGTFFVIFENLFEEEEKNLESSEFLDYPML